MVNQTPKGRPGKLMAAPGLCKTLRDFEGDVDSNYRLCCEPTFEGTNEGGLQSCPSIKIHESDKATLNQLYKKGSAIVCQSQPKEGNDGPENPYFDWIKKENLTGDEKKQLCDILEQFTNKTETAANRAYSTQIQFASPSSTKTPVIVSHYSVAAGKEIKIGDETEKAKKECSDALNTRKTKLGEVIRAEIYNDLCDQGYVGDGDFCDDDGDQEDEMAEVLAKVKEELRKTNDDVISACSRFTNTDLKDVMQTMINLSTSDDSNLNQAAANVCGSLPWMYWRSFNNGRNSIPNTLIPDDGDDCQEPNYGNWELRLPQNRSTLNVKIDVMKALGQWNSRCDYSTEDYCLEDCKNTKVDAYLNSLRAVVETQFFKDLRTDETKFTDICRNLRMTPKDVNRTNGMIKTGVLGSEFKSLIEGQIQIADRSVSGFKFATQPSLSGQMALKDDWMRSALDNIPRRTLSTLSRTLGNAHSQNAEIFCEFNHPEDASTAPLPVFSQNPFMVMYSMGKSLGGDPDWDTSVGLYPLGAFRDKAECKAWTPQ
jgi:hypothetical protein